MLRYYKIIAPIILLCLASCQRKEFMDDLVGNWAITEITYNQNGLVTTEHPTQLTMKFTYTHYSTFLADSLTESGTYIINGPLTQVIFDNGADQYKFKILDHNDHYQHWKRDLPSIGLTIEFKMDKI